jgi:hypothetical protein
MPTYASYKLRGMRYSTSCEVQVTRYEVQYELRGTVRVARYELQGMSYEVELQGQNDQSQP